MYDLSAATDQENTKYLTINEQMRRLLRGGSFNDQPVNLRGPYRVTSRPGNRIVSFGFRPARTLPRGRVWSESG